MEDQAEYKQDQKSSHPDVPAANLETASARFIAAIFYVIAVVLLSMHLYHGLWSMFQSLGFSHPRYTPLLKRGAAAVAILIAIGNCSIPIAVLLRLLSN